MDYRPEDVHYGSAEAIEIRPFAYIGTGATATVIPVSNVDGFQTTKSVTVEKADGTVLAAAVVSAINRLARTITLTGPGFSEAPAAGDTLVGHLIADLGGTDGGITIADKPEMINVEYDQIEGDVESFPVHHSVDVRFTLKECRFDQWGILSQAGYTRREAATNVVGGNILTLGGGRSQKFGIRFVIPDPDPLVTFKKRLTFWKVASMEGIETAFAKRDPAQNPVTLHVLADPSRPRHARFGMAIDEDTAALP